MNVLWAEPEPSAQPVRMFGTMHAVAKAVAATHDLSVEDLVGSSKCHWIAHPRQEAMAKIDALGRFSHTQIGRFFGGRFPSTVWKGIRAHAKRQAEGI